MSENQKAVEHPCRGEKIKYVTAITKHHILSFWRHNKQAHWANPHLERKNKDIITALYSTGWLWRNRLTELNQCDRVNDRFSLLNSGCGAAGVQGPQVTLGLSVASAQTHSMFFFFTAASPDISGRPRHLDSSPAGLTGPTLNAAHYLQASVKYHRFFFFLNPLWRGPTRSATKQRLRGI